MYARFRFPCLVPFLVVAHLAAGATSESGLISNGGFETGLNGWQRTHGRVSASADRPHSGQSCLRIERAGAVTTDFIEVRDALVEISGWMRAVGVRRGKRPWNQAGFQITRYDADKKPYGRNAGRGEFGRAVGDTGWKQYHASVIGKKGICYIRVQCHLWDCAAGVGYFDDVKIVRKPIPQSYLRVRPRSEVEDNAPIVWPMPPVMPGPDTVDNGSVRLRFGSDTSPCIEVASAAGSFLPALAGFRLRFSRTGRQFSRGDGLDVSGGYSVRRSYMTRRVETWQPTAPEGDASDVQVRFFAETFWRSPWVYLYPRIVFSRPTEVDSVQSELLLPEGYTTAHWFDGTELRAAELGVRPRVTFGAKTVKPFFAVEGGEGEMKRGVVIFLPLPPEVRTWYVEDYVPAERPVTVELSPQSIKFTVQRFRTPDSGHHSSLDLYYTLMPYVGCGVTTALSRWPTDEPLPEPRLPFGPDVARGFWTKRMPRSGAARPYRCSRYFPVEAFSFGGIDKPSPTYDYWHVGGHAWGMLTGTFKGVNFSGFRRDGFHRDTAIRLGQFYMERADELGQPPALTMVGSWARAMPAPNAIYRFHFGQFGEFTLPMFRRWLLESEVGQPEDKELIWSRLNRLRRLFDPANPNSWTWPTPESGYWFCYSNVFRKEPEPGFVINTHTTAVGNAGELMRIARGLGKQHDYAWWRGVFRKGVDGLLWDLSFDDAWYVGAHDPNEVRYGRRCGGP